MTSLDEFLAGLGHSLPDAAGGVGPGAAVHVTAVGLVLPVELRPRGRELEASMPRGRLATGFTRPVARLAVRFESGAGAEAGSVLPREEA